MSNEHFWDARKSATLSLVVSWVALAAGVACIPLLIPLLKTMRVPGTTFDDYFVRDAFVPLYVCLAFGIAALIALIRLLRDVRDGEVFTAKNVARLRLISYCGFAIMLACAGAAIFAQPRPIFIFMAMVAGFLGLLMRVVKNVIDAARLLKEDADYTI